MSAFGFLSPAEAVIARAASSVMMPPDPPDITRWCEENIVFDERSPMPGPFRIDRFPFLREIHQVLSPEHPSREVTVRGSAQWGKTVSIIQPTIGSWFSYAALDALVVHPTTSAAKEWVMNKWLPMRRQTPALREIFGSRSGDNTDTMMNQETLARDGSLKITSAGSPSDLTGTSRRLVIMDDLSKWEMTDKGDPEALAISRAEGFEDAKILRVSTPLIAGTCRVSRAFARSDQRYYHVPCPHCGNEAALTWDNFRKNIDPERLHAACFTCDSCGAVIRHSDKERIVGLGHWVATNPKGDHPGFHLWRAYAPQRDWASIAVSYAQVMGWTRLSLTQETENDIAQTVEAETEQVFWNDVLGLPYEQASKGPDWEALRNRVENAEDGTYLPPGILPSTGFIFAAGVDCQQDRIEVHLVAFGRNYRRWTIDYKVIPHSISDQEGREQLNALLKTTWRTERGKRFAIDKLAIDCGAFTADVWAWVKESRHPWSRVILVKGGSTQNGPIMKPMYEDVGRNGKIRKRDKRAWLINVNQLKADFYNWLAKEDPVERGFCAFAKGLGDEFYRMITAEVRVLKRNRFGVTVSQWELAEPGRRNEALDTMNYAEIAARQKGWAAMTEEQWAAIEDERGGAPEAPQPDLFDEATSVVPTQVAQGVPKTEKPAPKTGSDWFGGVKGNKGSWF